MQVIKEARRIKKKSIRLSFSLRKRYANIAAKIPVALSIGQTINKLLLVIANTKETCVTAARIPRK